MEAKEIDYNRVARVIAAMIEGEPYDDVEYVLSVVQQTRRVVNRDKQSYICTRDFRPDRINITVDNGIITKAVCG